MVRINQPAPDFEVNALVDGTIKRIRLSDFRGQWVALVFYPADFTFVCPTELGELADRYGDFRGHKCEVLSISTDTAYVHKAWHDESPTIGKIRFPMLADPSGQVTRSFGVMIENEGLALRGTFLIDPDGVVKVCEIHDNSIGRSADELLRKLQAAQFVREHGEVCPASWKPGDKGMRPGLELVGKI